MVMKKQSKSAHGKESPRAADVQVDARQASDSDGNAEQARVADKQKAAMPTKQGASNGVVTPHENLARGQGHRPPSESSKVGLSKPKGGQPSHRVGQRGH